MVRARGCYTERTLCLDLAGGAVKRLRPASSFGE